ncbi:CREB/ATF bZIP mRNAion factor-like isoform X1 [Huso huso]|uniref:CREB/ATF bZIP mRNAion factor-like isoform X1 n=1 Tax=Huso huso TaxID=61971 RepID=A0ABR0ZMP9_HUSHU
MRHSQHIRNSKLNNTNNNVLDEDIKVGLIDDLFSSSFPKICPEQGRTETKTEELQQKHCEMITRKRKRTEEAIQLETTSSKPASKNTVCDAFEVSENTTRVNQQQQFSHVTSEELSGLEFSDLFDIEDFNWELDKDPSSPLFEVGLDGFPHHAPDDTTTQLDSDLSSFGSLQNLMNSEGGATDAQYRFQNQQRSGQKAQQFTADLPGRSNRNAIAARVNRLKKKEYVNGLENKVTSLATENKELKEENKQLSKRLGELEDETRYLRAVLANESTLAQLLSRLAGGNGMKLSTSLFKEPKENDHDYALPGKRVKLEEKETSGGVCLHVDNNIVSVEFCSKCAESANSSHKIFFLGDCLAMLCWWGLQNSHAPDSMWILLWWKLKKRDLLLASCPDFY